ncbi:MAG TPA: hotdog fold domain-containing protein [Candidatus Thermoplasmatota archaeon]|nr:hotdog fold domain-containing protein [Candidatus Thermoplasmatota archaeon]
MLLENDPANPCFGCGPENPLGLRLAFAREGDDVRAQLRVTESMVGWPQRLHSGLLYLALLETANWTVYGTLGRVGLPTRTGALDGKRWVRVGETLTLRGSWDAAARVARCEALDERGELVARLEREYVFPTRAEFRARMGEDALPPEFEELVPE